MEEYDIDLNFHIIKDENGEMEIISDIDDNIDYLEPEERVNIAIKLLHQLFNQIYSNIDEDTDEDTKFEIKQEGIAYRDALFKSILNMCQNMYAKKTGDVLLELEYSMGIYYGVRNKLTNEDLNIVYQTAHSPNINVLEPLNVAGAMVTDVLDAMLDEDYPKEEIDKILKVFMGTQYKDFKERIKSYEQDQE